MKEAKWVLELGCGCGFLAVSTLKTNDKLKCYVATDRSRAALDMCKENISLNLGDSLKAESFSTVKIEWSQDVDDFANHVKSLNNKFERGCLLGAGKSTARTRE